MKDIEIAGLPANIPDSEKAIFVSRVLHAYEQIIPFLGKPPQPLLIGPAQKMKRSAAKSSAEFESSKNTTDEQIVHAIEPQYSFKQLILPEKTLDEIETAIQLLKVEDLVFDQWGLRAIEPNPKVALNFYGPPGTGKTLAAHAIANYLKRKIIVASYAEIESKYHGDGPKNVKKIFAQAETEGAILFIDEADSLLSRRLSNVTQGSEQAINSMRSQLLINLEQFHGLVIFSTNLIENYDKAFETRVRHVKFEMPDENCRRAIWQQHLPPQLPLADDVNADILAKKFDDVCGRDIRNAVLQAATKAAVKKQIVDYGMLESQIQHIKESRIKEKSPQQGRKLTEEEKTKIGNALKGCFHNQENINKQPN